MPRKVEYIPDGIPIRATVAEVIAAWPSKRIPPQYAVGTASHEVNTTRAGFAINERDEEEPDKHGNVYVSDGPFQISRSEAIWVGMPRANLFDLVEASRVFAKLQEERLGAIMRAARITAPVPDVWAYLGMSHNFGLSATMLTIHDHGLDWQKWCERNPTHTSAIAYFSDCITGGPHWPAA